MAIYITGDTHGNIDRSKLDDNKFKDGNKLTREDYVIIAGDVCVPSFGQTVENNTGLGYYEKKKYTTLFVEGNHENFAELNKLPVSEWHGGKVHILADNFIHLMRGQVYTIEDKKIFTFGGAYSPDRAMRLIGYSWFTEEECSYAEKDEAISNLDKINNKVDIIISHTCGAEYMQRNVHKLGISYVPEWNGATEHFLDYIEDICEYNMWYFGHYHYDKKLDTKHTLLYNDIIKI